MNSFSPGYPIFDIIEISFFHLARLAGLDLNSLTRPKVPIMRVRTL